MGSIEITAPIICDILPLLTTFINNIFNQKIKFLKCEFTLIFCEKKRKTKKYI